MKSRDCVHLFHQEEDFLIRIWRPENAGASLSTDHQTAHEVDHMSEPIKRLIIAIKGDTKTREEIMNIMQLNHRENFRLNLFDSCVGNRLYCHALSR